MIPPTAMKAWIKDIINENDLQGIIFIWDEFTDYFANNVPVTPLQEPAQATVDMPFYLFIVTHKAFQVSFPVLMMILGESCLIDSILVN